jgi:cysteinyl-tRNA synthetase
VLRYALLAAHYRAPLEFSEASLSAAASAVERLGTCLLALDAYHADVPDDPTLTGLLDGARTAFGAALDDDLDVPVALATTFDLVRDLNRRLAERSSSTDDARRAAALLRDLDQVLAVMEDDGEAAGDEVERLLAERAAARAAREWARSDALRDELARLDVIVEDTPDGQRWRRAAGATRG